MVGVGSSWFDDWRRKGVQQLLTWGRIVVEHGRHHAGLLREWVAWLLGQFLGCVREWRSLLVCEAVENVLYDMILWTDEGI